MTEQRLKITLVDRRKSACECRTTAAQVHDVRYVETPRRPTTHPRCRSQPHRVQNGDPDADVVILAVPDVALGPVLRAASPAAPASAGTVLTLDPRRVCKPAVSARRHRVCGRASLPSVEIFCSTARGRAERPFQPRRGTPKMSWLLWRQATPTNRLSLRRWSGEYGPVGATSIRSPSRATTSPYLETTLVEVVACMVGDLLNDALQQHHPHRRSARTRRSVPC